MKAEVRYSYARHLQEYSNSDTEIKVKFLLSNYNRLPKLIDSYESTWEIIVKAEKRYNARAELGDIGIRVQRTRNSNPTMAEALINAELDLAKTETNLRVLVKGTDNPAQRIKEKLIIQDMRDDYSIIVNAIHSLDQKDEEIFLRYLNNEYDVNDIADCNQITYTSAKSKIYNIRKTVILNATENIKLKYEILNRREGNED
jgi:hypothetical protein